MMKNKLLNPSVTCLIALLLGGCSNSNYWMQTMEGNNNFSYKPSSKQNVRYEFEIKNFFDVDFDGDKRSDRERLINNLLVQECPKGAKIINEKTMVTGKWVTGKPLTTYFSDVNCL